MTKLEEEYEKELRSLIVELSERMLGTQTELHDAVIEEGIRVDESEMNILIAEHIRRCPECNMWVKKEELLNEELSIVPCESCRS